MVSTEEQAAHGISMDAQRAKNEAYALSKDLDLAGIIEDAGKSAKDLSAAYNRCLIWPGARRWTP